MKLSTPIAAHLSIDFSCRECAAAVALVCKPLVVSMRNDRIGDMPLKSKSGTLANGHGARLSGLAVGSQYRETILKRRADRKAAAMRYDHHPDPAIAFEIEVEQIEALHHNVKIGFGAACRDERDRRVARAMGFRVGGDAGAVAAKDRLRVIEREAGIRY